jgi:hypothetical protein
MWKNPRWWDIVFHTRPRRAKDKAVTRAVAAGAIDVDAANWSVGRRPQEDYW